MKNEIYYLISNLDGIMIREIFRKI